MNAARRGTAVIGIGNVVLSDDGLGVHAVRRLRDRYRFGDDIELIEGGTAGLLLLPSLADARRAIIVDAIDTGTAPGALVRLDAEKYVDAHSWSARPRTPSASATYSKPRDSATRGRTSSYCTAPNRARPRSARR